MQDLPPFVIPLLLLLALVMAGLLIAWLVRYIAGSRTRTAGRAESLTRPAESGLDDAALSDQDHVLCVSRAASGQVSITVQGKPYSRLRDIKDPEVGRLAVDAVKGVLLFAEDLLPSAVRRSFRSVKPPIAAAGGAAAQQLAEDKAQLTPRQLVDEIDELVQSRLRDLPELPERSIRLREAAGGGLVIFVGQNHYESVDRIPDEAVRRLIREAIAEWERR